MKSNTEKNNLFKTLEKMFKFNQKNQQIFVPKEVAQQLVYEEEPKKRGRKPKLTTPQVVKEKVKTNIFDLVDTSDIDPKVKLKVRAESESDFSSRVFNLFDIAKRNGITSLTIDQITCAYYRVYTLTKKDSLKTRNQIANKMYHMDFSKNKNVRNAHVVKVKGTSSTYTISDYK